MTLDDLPIPYQEALLRFGEAHGTNRMLLYKDVENENTHRTWYGTFIDDDEVHMCDWHVQSGAVVHDSETVWWDQEDEDDVPEFIQHSVELVLQQDKRRAPYLTG
jgi:hypothetical protein